MNRSQAIFPGSFDPLTNGHVDLVVRALSVFDRVLVAVLDNPNKETLFSVKERTAFVRESFQRQGESVQVHTFSGLLVDFAREQEVKVVLRGLRAISDFDYEAQMALMNRSLNPEIETFFLMTRERYSYISSTLVKQIAPFGGDVSSLVPPPVAAALEQKLALR